MTQTTDPKAADAAKKTEAKAADAAPAAAAPTLELGKTVRLRAVHGDLIHPFLQPEVRFETDKSQKVIVDSWTKIQFEAGKLALDD